MNEEQNQGFVESERGVIINQEALEKSQPKRPDMTPPEPKKKSHAGKIVGFLCFIFVVGLLAFAATQIDYAAIVDNIAGASFDATPEMNELIERIDLTDEGLRILRATHPELQGAEDFNKNCDTANDNSSVLGCYKDNHIYVYNITKNELAGIRETTLAHELLHAVWRRMSMNERESLKDDLTKVHDNNEEIRKHLESYSSSEWLDELHSYAGTSVKLGDMSEKLQNHYKKYFNNHSKIVGYYDDYYEVFKKADDYIKELSAKIKEHREKLASMQEAYMANNAQLTKDIADFNSRAANGTFDTVAQFEEERSALVARKTQLTQDYQEVVQYVNETNSLIEEYNKNVLHTQELQRSTNSSIEAPSGTPKPKN